MTLARTCCCDPGPAPIVCCAEWPTYCASPATVGYYFYSIHRSQIHVYASIELDGLTPSPITATYDSATTAIDPETANAECSFPDPISDYPYDVPMPGLAQIPTRPWNYSVPVFRGSNPSAGDYEIVWPILNRCCIGGAPNQLVVGFEVRGSDLIGKIVAQLGVSPNNLTGAYNGTGRHWYSLSNGNFRFFADPGLWSRDGLAAGLASFQPFRLGHDNAPTTIEHTGAVPFTFTHIDWCRENGYGHPCRCNFSFPEDPACCDFYTANIGFSYFDGCITHTVSTSVLMAAETSACPPGGSPQDNVAVKNSLQMFGPSISTGSYSIDKIRTTSTCCVDYLPPNNISTFIDLPYVTIAKVGCNLTANDAPCLSCDPYPQDQFDAVFCVNTSYILDADVPFGDPCAGGSISNSVWVIGVYMRNSGYGCCIDGYEPRRAFVLDVVAGQCIWRPLNDFTLTFDCE